jgi:hypothetical protein
MGAELDGLDSLEDRLDEIDDNWGSSQEIVYRVVVDKSYAVFIEFGRGPVEAQDAEALRFTVDGETVFAKSVGPAPAQPFMRPAIREANRNLQSLATDATSLDDFLRRTALFTEGEARDRAARDTGDMARAIESERVK